MESLLIGVNRPFVNERPIATKLDTGMYRGKSTYRSKGIKGLLRRWRRDDDREKYPVCQPSVAN